MRKLFILLVFWMILFISGCHNDSTSTTNDEPEIGENLSEEEVINFYDQYLTEAIGQLQRASSLSITEELSIKMESNSQVFKENAVKVLEVQQEPMISKYKINSNTYYLTLEGNQPYMYLNERGKYIKIALYDVVEYVPIEQNILPKVYEEMRLDRFSNESETIDFEFKIYHYTFDKWIRDRDLFREYINKSGYNQLHPIYFTVKFNRHDKSLSEINVNLTWYLQYYHKNIDGESAYRRVTEANIKIKFSDYNEVTISEKFKTDAVIDDFPNELLTGDKHPQLTLGESLRGKMDYSYDQDVFYMKVEERGKYRVNLDYPSDIQMKIYSKNKSELKYVADNLIIELDPGEYYIMVINAQRANREYKIIFDKITLDDYADSVIEESYPIGDLKESNSFEGIINYVGDQDLFRLDTGYSLELTLIADDSVRLLIYNSKRTLVDKLKNGETFIDNLGYSGYYDDYIFMVIGDEGSSYRLDFQFD